ncbi:Enoyl-CoA hydratase/isomerase [Streptosporangium subroseum]|uniref:Enoyl-CoA hydratase/isomerase n=1 Tax=Streptosporangium subroseum TaxID=106412 RepID=A0A239K232_9ACTN|nr:Enoyl-CoA hydratase/isomerase [Streptosporangium subroseum]
MADSIWVDTVRDIVRLTIDGPERQNSIDAEVIEELHRALDDAERRPDCRIVLLEGGDGVFCTGMDLGEAATGPAEEGGEAFFGLLKRFTTTSRVIVSRAAVSGSSRRATSSTRARAAPSPCPRRCGGCCRAACCRS